jgi:hypothetical protein
VAFLCLVYLVMKSIQNFGSIEMDINAVQNWVSENYMDLRILMISAFLVRFNTATIKLMSFKFGAEYVKIAHVILESKLYFSQNINY